MRKGNIGWFKINERKGKGIHLTRSSPSQRIQPTFPPQDATILKGKKMCGLLDKEEMRGKCDGERPWKDCLLVVILRWQDGLETNGLKRREPCKKFRRGKEGVITKGATSVNFEMRVNSAKRWTKGHTLRPHEGRKNKYHARREGNEPTSLRGLTGWNEWTHDATEIYCNYCRSVPVSWLMGVRNRRMPGQGLGMTEHPIYLNPQSTVQQDLSHQRSTLLIKMSDPSKKKRSRRRASSEYQEPEFIEVLILRSFSHPPPDLSLFGFNLLIHCVNLPCVLSPFHPWSPSSSLSHLRDCCNWPYHSRGCDWKAHLHWLSHQCWGFSTSSSFLSPLSTRSSSSYVQTNLPEYSKKEFSIRRRYKEFAWLKAHLRYPIPFFLRSFIRKFWSDNGKTWRGKFLQMTDC